MIPIGKGVGQHVYFHVEGLGALSEKEIALVRKAAALGGLGAGVDFNVVKLERDGMRLSLLDYPDFFDIAFPVLRRAWTVDLMSESLRFRTYAESLNPPILHRKELLLSESDPRRIDFQTLTRAAEALGLFDDPTRIGFQRPWEVLLSQRGYRVAGHELVPLGNNESGSVDEDAFSGSFTIARHRTALNRYGFSAPVQTLARFGFLDGLRTFFDYGCGRGDDVRGLQENGIQASGWDPYFAPEQEKCSADLVNLGFVINVIEDQAERLDALRGAYALAKELLVVSAMISHPDAVTGTPYGDGILTSRNTFQKYFRQDELRVWLAGSLEVEPLPAGPGIFYIFKDQDSEQRFLLGRQENRRRVLRLAQLSRPEKQVRIGKAEAKYLEHRELLERLWECILALGRDPDRSETSDFEAITQHFGSLTAALRFIKSRKENSQSILEQARSVRIDGLRVFFAEGQFQQRKPYRHLEAGLQRDIKAFFGDYQNAQAEGRALLFSAGRPELIENACREAAERGLGWLDEGKSLQLPTRLIPELPPVLRAYVGCGLRLYGDAESADLLKIHIRSGKLTLMSFDDFEGNPLPRMIRRVKLKLRTQDFELFEYGDSYPSPYLYLKSRYVNEEYPNYVEQVEFDKALEDTELFDFAGYGPKPDEFDNRLTKARWQIQDFHLLRSNSIPDPDSPCGRYLTYRQLIECGETQARTGLPNRPKHPDSYTALYELATNILDPVIDYFGMIKLTYGFCSSELSRHIKRRIAPKLDQHAAHDLNRLGKPICPRLGAAADFIVEDEDMKEVAYWIAANLPFDRLYFYGSDRPIHISYSASPKKEAWELKPQCNGRSIPTHFR